MTTFKKHTLRMLSFIFLPISLAIIGEFLLKATINNGQILSFNIPSIFFIIKEPGIIIGAGLIVIAGLLWLVAMSKFELSFIYPFLSINYVVIVIGSKIFLNEEVNLNRYIAMILIILGLFFISRSPYSETEETLVHDEDLEKK